MFNFSGLLFSTILMACVEVILYAVFLTVISTKSGRYTLVENLRNIDNKIIQNTMVGLIYGIMDKKYRLSIFLIILIIGSIVIFVGLNLTWLLCATFTTTVNVARGM